MNKIKKSTLLIFFSILFCANLFSQTKKIIIDTDCGFDDLSAITMFMSMTDIEIVAVTSCGGNVDAGNGFYKLYNLFQTAKDSLNYSYNLSSFLVGADSNTGEIPLWRTMCENAIWGYAKKPTFEYFPKSEKKLPEIIENSQDEIYYICLGPFTNLAKILKSNSNLTSKIKKIYWYNGTVNSDGFNYEFDKKSADYIMSLDLQIDVISNLDNQSAKYDEEMTTEIKDIQNLYSELIVTNLLNFSNHNQTLWDELVAVYFLYPELFDMLPQKSNPKISINTSYNLSASKKAIIKIFKQDFSSENNVVFENFPYYADIFQYDVAEIADTVVQLYGIEEWKSCILTNEFHRHLGIYSIVGAKMGIAALEYFGCEKDGLQVVSYAGNKPPVSCLNDGLQMSTGATLGYGTISFSENTDIVPEADFIYNGKKIHVQLKPEYITQVETDIQTGILTYGNLTDGYWKLIRTLGIKYWKEWDRSLIFEITKVE